MIKIMIQGWNYKKPAQKEQFDGTEAVFAPLKTYLALSACYLGLRDRVPRLHSTHTIDSIV